MEKVRPKTHTVLVHACRAWKSCRDKVSGIFRGIYARPDIQVALLDPWHASKGKKDKALSAVDGLITSISVHPSTVTIPCVSFEGAPSSASHTISICCDNEAVAQAAAELLFSRGHTFFAYVGDMEDRDISLERERSFVAAVMAKGFPCFVYNKSHRSMSALTKFLTNLPKPCGLMAYSDSIAQLVLDACHAAHLSVPEQINIVGVDNEIEICESVRPTLTSIQLDFEQAGFIAAQLMQDLLDGRPIPQNTHTYGVRRIIERESTQDINGSQRLITQVRTYLQTHFREALTVGDLAARFHTSRRRLEMRFREILGHTVHDEIERLRIEEGKRLLNLTSMPIGEIATSCGYVCDDTFRNAFVSVTGLTPRAYRNQINSSATPSPSRAQLTRCPDSRS